MQYIQSLCTYQVCQNLYLFYLKYLLELPDEEIAQRLGISPGSVRTYLSRARKHARKLIKLD